MRKEPKRFPEWMKLKAKIHRADNHPRISEGEIWWSAVGENVGVEVNGKHNTFARPVLVFKKFNRNSFLAVPLTSKQKEGNWYVEFYFHKRVETAILSQAKAMSVSRLYNRVGRIADQDFLRIKKGLLGLLFCDKNTPSAVKTEGSRVNLENLPLLYQIISKKSTPTEKTEEKNEA